MKWGRGGRGRGRDSVHMHTGKIKDKLPLQIQEKGVFLILFQSWLQMLWARVSHPTPQSILVSSMFVWGVCTWWSNPPILSSTGQASFYIDPYPFMVTCRSDALVQWAARSFSQAWFVLYEQIHPDDPFGCVMRNHFSRLHSQLCSLAQYPDCLAQKTRFLQRVSVVESRMDPGGGGGNEGCFVFRSGGEAWDSERMGLFWDNRLTTGGGGHVPEMGFGFLSLCPAILSVAGLGEMQCPWYEWVLCSLRSWRGAAQDPGPWALWWVWGNVPVSIPASVLAAKGCACWGLSCWRGEVALGPAEYPPLPLLLNLEEWDGGGDPGPISLGQQEGTRIVKQFSFWSSPASQISLKDL